MLRLAVLLLIAPAAAWLSARAPRATVSMRATASRRQALVFPAALLIASSVSAEDVAIDAAAPAPAPAGDAPPPSLPTPPPSLPTPPPRPSAVAAVQAEAKPFDPSRRGAFNEKALFKEDFYFKFGVAPKFKDGVVELPKGADLPFSPVKRRRAMATLCFAVAHPGPRSLRPASRIVSLARAQARRTRSSRRGSTTASLP